MGQAVGKKRCSIEGGDPGEAGNNKHDLEPHD